MFERFTDRARRVVVLAQEEARMLKHNYIGTEHILLGILHEGEAVGFQALTALGIDFEQARTAVLAKIGEGQQPPSGNIPYTSRAKKTLELALREALQLGHNYIGTEHLLLGLIREGEGVGAQILTEAGVELNKARQCVIQLLSGTAAKAKDQGWLKKVTPVEVYVVNCSYCNQPITGAAYPQPVQAIEAAQAAGAILTTLGGLSFNGPPVACAECQKRPLSEFRTEAS